MSHAINLPPLEIRQRNFASSCLGVCNRRFAIYQVDTHAPPFWCVEIGPNNKPTGPATTYTNHADAVACVSNWARGYLVGRQFPHVAVGEHDDTPALDDTFHRIEMDV